ncbi:MAG: two-component system sensor histidine kinase FlrB [Gammaproteobacteria bacterium]|jgi:two-component system sensor histidine kinase FlrB
MGATENSRSANLQAAFADFEVVSTQLASSYQKLEAQVAQLTVELKLSRAAEVIQVKRTEIVVGRFGSLLDALPAGVVVLDGSGCIAQFNPAAVDLLGSLNTGERWIDIVTRAFLPQWDDGHDISLVDGRRVNIATEALQGEPGQILLLKDVSETRRLQEMLNHQRRISAKTELAAALAHQIRTPLSAALLHTSNLLNRPCDQSAHRHGAERALDSMRQLERLVEDMLTFARGTKMNVEPCELPRVLERLSDNFKSMTEGGQFKLLIAPPIPELTLFGNPDALVSMMLNLVLNARTATNGCGSITVSANVLEDSVQLMFEDNGPGISPRHAAHIFEPFFTNSTNGTGLGLAVARSIARVHDGDLTFDESCLDGARFALVLPLPKPLVPEPVNCDTVS